MNRTLNLDVTKSKRITINVDEVSERIKNEGPKLLVDSFVYGCLSESGVREHDLEVKHIWAIVQVATQCESVIEFGVRRGISTLALGFGLKESAYDTNWMKSYDIVPTDPSGGLNWDTFITAAKIDNIDAEFILGNSRKITIPETDLLFVDSYHSYSHFMEEMRLHSHRAKKFIIMHDSSKTGTFGLIDQKDGYDQSHDYKVYEKEGMYNAAMDFAEKYKYDWEIFYHDNDGEGLTIFVTKNKELLADDFWKDTTPYKLKGETP